MATRTISDAWGNFNATATWVEGIVPVAGDAVVATATSGQLTINVASGDVGLGSFILTGYTNTITFDSTLTVAGDVTLAGTIAGTAGTLIVNTTATLTSNAKTLTCKMTFAGTSQTYTLADNWNIDGNITVSATTACTLTGNTINAGAGLSVSGTSCQLSGTTNIIMDGTGTLACSSTARSIANNLTFNTAGTITIAGGAPLVYKTGTLTYTAGTMSLSATALVIGGSCTLNTSGMTWINISNTVTSTTTLSSNLNLSGDLTTGLTTTTQTFNGAFNINVSGNLTHNGTTGSITGTATIVLAGTGNWSIPNSSIAGYNIAIVLNTAGTITLTSDIYWGNSAASFVWTAGTLVSTDYHFRVGTMTMNFNGNTINSLHLDRSSTGTITLSGNVLISGNFSTVDQPTSTKSIVSNIADTQRKLTLLAGATHDLTKLNATDIDSSDGQMIYTYNGVLDNATNWTSSNIQRRSKMLEVF